MPADARDPTPRGVTDSGFYVRHLDAISALERVKGYKRRTLDLLGAAPGQRVLDVGCGTGVEVRALAQLVGPAGEAIGIDISEAMVAEADAVGILRSSAAQAVKDGVVSPAEAQGWIEALERADQEGSFFASGTLFLAAARKP